MKLISAFRNSPFARKRIVGRLPLPRGAASLNGAASARLSSLKAVDTLVDRLCDLPLAAWLVIGHAVIADRVGASARAVAFARLETAIASRGLQIAAWHVRDAVDTAAFTAASGITHWTRANHRAFAAAHAAAEDAALALLVGDALSAPDRRVLAAPFTDPDSPLAPERSLAQSV